MSPLDVQNLVDVSSGRMMATAPESREGKLSRSGGRMVEAHFERFSGYL